MREKILAVISDRAQYDAKPETTIHELAVDSLELLELMLDISVECDLDYRQEKLLKIETVGDILAAFEA